MPCYDEPYNKADYGCIISVTAPDTFMVCANGELIDETNNPDDLNPFGSPLNKITTVQPYVLHQSCVWDDLLLSWTDIDFNIVPTRGHDFNNTIARGRLTSSKNSV